MHTPQPPAPPAHRSAQDPDSVSGTAAPADTREPPGRGADGRLYRVLRRLASTLRRLGWPAAAVRLSPREADGYALGTAYMLGARAWTLLHREPGWAAIQGAWAQAEARVADRDAFAGALSDRDALRLIAGGADGFAAREALYAGATDRIDIATYYIQSDETGYQTVRALSAAVARGVRVRLLVDRYTMGKKSVEVEGMGQLARAVREGGIELREWYDPVRPFDSTHRKMIVVDGRQAIVGGRNFADHYRADDWRDVDLVIEGPSVAPLGAVFERLWQGAPGRRGAGGDAPWVESTPANVREDPVMRFVIAAIGAARRSVDLELAYFVDHESLCGALARAARRGVRVRLLTNSAETNDLPYATWAAYEGVRQVLEAGGEAHARRGAGRTLHPKYVVVDGEWVSFGSHNMDYYSPRYCGEMNLVVRDRRLGSMLLEFFATGLAQATPLELDEVRASLARNTGSRLFDVLFRDFQ